MTIIDPFIDPVAGGLVSIVFDVAKRVGGSFTQVVSDRTQVADALKKYVDKYSIRYGTIRILGMKQDIGLETIYTKVQFLDELSIRRFASVEALEQNYREGKKRRFQIDRLVTLDGFDIVNKHQYLMVLGGPGAGKSTFLRRIGLEALRGNKGKYKHQCIPVFVELKRFNSDKIDLIRAITDELQNFGFPASHDFSVKALEQGKLLILLDGLDEVSKSQLNLVIDAIQNFVTRYDRNRFIASCRIAAHRSTLNRFRDIEIADFDNHQIEQFIHNWFFSEFDQQTQTAKRCWEVLNDPGNIAAKELAHTPLLLTFLCLVYNKTQGFPSNRATLYRKALDILLEEWAAEKRIMPGEIYQGLNPDLEKVLLADIACRGFVKDQFFFTQSDLVSQIKTFLSDTVDKPKYLDGRAVLDSIAVHQGILVERAEDIYSFSHLTLQEYLTAQYISQDYRRAEKLISKYLVVERWREVFLLIAGLTDRGHDLLLRMFSSTQKYINTPKLQNLIHWANVSTNGSQGNYKPLAKRSAAIFLALNLSRSKSVNRAVLLSQALSFSRLLALSIDPSPNLARALSVARILDLKLALSLISEFQKLDIFSNIDFLTLRARFGSLSSITSSSDLIDEARQKLIYSIHKVWIDALHLQEEWLELSEAEINSLARYLYANELMICCKNAAVRVSEKTWQTIEERMLTTTNMQ